MLIFFLTLSYIIIQLAPHFVTYPYEALKQTGTSVGYTGWGSLFMFSTSYLNGRVMYPLQHKICHITFKILFLSSILLICLLSVIGYSETINILTNICNLIIVAAGVYFIIFLFRTGKETETIFSGGLLVFFIAGLLSTLFTSDLLSIGVLDNYAIAHALEITGLLVHIFFFSAGIAQKTLIEKNLKTQLALQAAAAENTALRSQMNPHFIFNCLNTIDSFILTNKEDKASELLQKFSKLIRRVLDNSNTPVTTIEQDWATIQLYIDLQQEVHERKFKLQTEIDHELMIAGYQIPPLLLQPFVENAILHGLHHLPGSNGLLRVSLQLKKDIVKATIEDNGVGRRKAGEINKNRQSHISGMGIHLSQKRLTHFCNDDTGMCSIQYTDLEQNNQPCGTRVIIHFTAKK